jgi:uncharacterized protein YtpQ (UPF0354 family)
MKRLFGNKKEKPNIQAKENSNFNEVKKTESKIDSSQNDGLDTSIDEVKKNTEGYISLGRSIFPVIKSLEDEGIKLTNNINPLVKREIAEGIVVCYVIDLGDKLERISKSHLKQFNLDAEVIHNTAMRNLVDKVNENCKIKIHDYSSSNPEIKPFFEIEFDRNYNPSIMLLDDFWDTTAKEVTKSDLVAVSIPATNIIFMSDFKLMESFRTMRPVANSLYDGSLQEKLQLTKDTYIRKDGKWIKFLDTEEQFMELMDF